jgi:hypothetical protein
MQNIDRIQETAYQLILEFLTGEEKPIPRFDLNDETALLNLLYNRKVLFALSPLLEKKLSAPSVTKMKVLTAGGAGMTKGTKTDRPAPASNVTTALKTTKPSSRSEKA